MNLFDYQQFTSTTISDSVKKLEPKLRIMYYACGLAGETGEVVEKIKKIVRDSDGSVSISQRDQLALELGDILWYMARICSDLGMDLGIIPSKNAEKLKSRKERDVLHGSGDNR